MKIFDLKSGLNTRRVRIFLAKKVWKFLGLKSIWQEEKINDRNILPTDGHDAAARVG